MEKQKFYVFQLPPIAIDCHRLASTVMDCHRFLSIFINEQFHFNFKLRAFDHIYMYFAQYKY